MIEYKLIRGVRHYRMGPDERWKVDNVSKKEGEERLTKPFAPDKTASQIKTSPQRKNYSKSRRKKNTHTWLWIFLVIGMIAGVLYNHYDISLEETVIEQYMKGVEADE